MISRLIAAAFVVFVAPHSIADNTVSGYVRKDGTYVTPHKRSSPNGTNRDNYSTSGNKNPYTGSAGSRAPDYSSRAYSYGGSNPISTGSRGGQYYYNSKGNKTYVPKR